VSIRLSRRAFACLIALAVLVAGCATAQQASTPASSAPAAPTQSDVPSASASASTTDVPSASPSASPSEMVDRTVEVESPVAFSITVPGDWEEDDQVSSPTTSNFRAGLDRWIVFTELGPDTVEGWIDEVTSGAMFTASEPAAVELDGAAGFMIDFSLAEGETEATLFEEATWGAWTVASDRPNRLWVVDSPGGTILIVTDAPERAFDGWVESVDEALATLEWSE
jgi:hypothetical protein